ncbi:MAG: hypothetical protein IPK76_11070 [Lewinellaceae bacterium]|nr:hypothetical protein [Lewinellaceae bacterium]
MANAVVQRAFNAGYLIEKYLPQLSKMLVKGFQDKTSPFAVGFIAGSKEMVAEKVQSKSRFLERLKQNFGEPSPRKTSRNRDDKEMDIDI